MSGSNDTRDDIGGTFGTPDVAPCRASRRGPLNSPNPAVTPGLVPGTPLFVSVQVTGTAPVLVVSDASGRIAGSLTFFGYLDIVDCILNQNTSYTASVTSNSGGFVEVRVDPV